MVSSPENDNPATGQPNTGIADALALSRQIADLLDQKKATNIQLLDLRKANPYFCTFLIASLNSQLQLKTMVREIQKQFGQFLPQKSGLRPQDLDSGWVVLDFIDLVVHLFLDEQRQYYNLERLWGDAPRLEWK
ncbi:MAG: ribosome silencing factor [Leptospiraceae bacterium]|nr:ribosome silencing factor [Leptospiraceae bacterium]